MDQEHLNLDTQRRAKEAEKDDLNRIYVRGQSDENPMMELRGVEHLRFVDVVLSYAAASSGPRIVFVDWEAVMDSESLAGFWQTMATSRPAELASCGASARSKLN